MKVDGCVAYTFTPNEMKQKIDAFLFDTYGVKSEVELHFVSYRIYPVEASFNKMKLTPDERQKWEKVVRDIYRVSGESDETDEFGHVLLQMVFNHPVKRYLFSMHDHVPEYVYGDEDCVYVFVDEREKLPSSSDLYVARNILDWKS